ncbi:hypothetical protein SVAN01_00909 [Stagonosporopsis vannaccii]|nr:hypothetical protein SVAN01_00909 [Stagonosporopsis vannaccii]
MSGAFEIAAGAFAVVGVADVLIRSGRELYSFLQRIDDAPEDARKLQQTIEETVALVNASKACLERLAQHPDAASADKVTLSFRQALNSLERELKSLKILVAKIRGTTKKWDRIKFVLDQNRVAKALQRLEHSKLSITAALSLGNGELSDLNTNDLKTIVLHGTQAASARDQEIVDILTSTSDITRGRHRELSSAHASQQRSLKALQDEQTKMKIRQRQHMTISATTQKEVIRMSQDIRQQTRFLMTQHQKTQDLVISALGELDRVQLTASLPRSRSDRPIHFYGERRDLIVTYLLFLRDGLELAFDQLNSQDDFHSHLKQVATLQSNLEPLLSSAAQEQAMQYSRSTARPFDRWIYSETALDLTKLSETDVQIPESGTTEAILACPRGGQHDRNTRRERKLRTSRISTNLGDFIIYTKDSITDSKSEVGVSMTYKTASSSVWIDVRFAYRPVNGIRTPLYTHLNTSIVINDLDQLLKMAPLLKEHIEQCVELDHPVSEEDVYRSKDVFRSLVTGVLRLFQTGDLPSGLTASNGIIELLHALAANLRSDILDYVIGQGFDLGSTRAQMSLIYGLCWAESFEDVTNAQVQTFLAKVINDLEDPVAFLSNLIICGLAMWSDGLVLRCAMQMLRTLEPGLRSRCLQKDLTSDEALPIPGDYRQLIAALIGIGADPELPDSRFRPYLSSAINYSQHRSSIVGLNEAHADIVELLSALIGMGSDVHGRDFEGDTPSMYARRGNRWDEWCEALLQNGRDIKDLLVEEDNEWLLDDDWFEIAQARGYAWTQYSDTDSEAADSIATSENELSDTENTGSEEGDVGYSSDTTFKCDAQSWTNMQPGEATS